MFLIKIYIDLEKNIENIDASISFYDFIKKKRNISSINKNNVLSDTYIILNHNEYILKNFFQELLSYTDNISYKNKNILFVKNEKEADIKIYNISSQGFNISNINNNKGFFFSIESHTPIPYFTGLYMKSNIEINNKRKYLLGYTGGIWRGERDNQGRCKRKLFVDKLKIINSEKNSPLFYLPLIANNHAHEGTLGWRNGEFGKSAMDTYYNSVFSWQPYGDTPTRRGFYEALLCGNIPIISRKSYNIYKNLLIGRDKLDKICIILDDNEFYDASYITEYLLSIKNNKIQSYISEINKVKSKLHWNIFAEENAFHDIINVVIK